MYIVYSGLHSLERHCKLPLFGRWSGFLLPHLRLWLQWWFPRCRLELLDTQGHCKRRLLWLKGSKSFHTWIYATNYLSNSSFHRAAVRTRLNRVSIMWTVHARLAHKERHRVASISVSPPILLIMPRINTSVPSPTRSLKILLISSAKSWPMALLRVHSLCTRISYSTSLAFISMSMDVHWADMPSAYSAGASGVTARCPTGWSATRGTPTGETMASSAFCAAKITAASRVRFQRVCLNYKRSISISKLSYNAYSFLKYATAFFTTIKKDHVRYRFFFCALYVCKQLVTI